MNNQEITPTLNLNVFTKEEKAVLSIKDLIVYSKTQFYGTKKDLREHIASYKDYAILLKSSELKEELDKKKTSINCSLVLVKDLKNLKKVNGNIIRKIQPLTLSPYEKIPLVNQIISKLDLSEISI